MSPSTPRSVCERDQPAGIHGQVIARVADDSHGLTWAGLLSLGTVSALLVVLGFGLGRLADGLLHTSPILVIVGIALGIGAAMSFTFVRIRSFLKE